MNARPWPVYAFGYVRLDRLAVFGVIPMRLLAALLVCVIGLSGSMPQVRTAAHALPHDAYIWQRSWTPYLVTAAHRSSDMVRGWRILLAESDNVGR